MKALFRLLMPLTLLGLQGCTTGDGMKQINPAHYQLVHDKEIEFSKKARPITATLAESLYQRFGLTFKVYKAEVLAERIPKLYAPKSYLNDRIAVIESRKQITKYFVDSTKALKSGSFELVDKSYSGKNLYLRWTMVLELKSQPDVIHKFKGMSHIMVDETEAVIFHYDYWDFSEMMEKIPMVGGLTRFVRSKAASH